jgi:pimeloyl-ACP methyl ester carboxylesterase
VQPRGDPVLLLHGQPGGAHDWNRVVTAIGARAQAFAIDRPGWDGASRPCGLQGNADAALGALDRAGVGRAVVGGYSLGGAVAAWLAAIHPDRVSKLVLIAPAANPESLVGLDYLLAAPVLGELTSAFALAGAGAALATRPLRRLISARLRVDPGDLGGTTRRYLAPGTWGSFVAEQRMLIRELPQLQPLLGRIGAPTTILIGKSDRIVPPASARKLAEQIRGAQLHEIDHANHLLLHQHAERVAAALVG